MKKSKSLQLIAYLLLISFHLNAQKLIIPRNNTEYMCIPVELLSNFDNLNNFAIGNGSYLVDGQNHLNASAAVSTDGMNGTKCLRIQSTQYPFPVWGGTFYLKYNLTSTINSTEGVGVWLKSNKDALVNFYFEDAKGVSFMIPKKSTDGNAGWVYSYAMPNSYRLTNNSSSTENPSITYPCKFVGFGFQVMEDNTLIYLDEISKIQENNRNLSATVQTTPQKTANVYSIGETVNASFTSASNKLKLQIKNYKGEIIQEQVGDKTLNIQLPTGTLGYYEILVLSYLDEITPTKLISGSMFCYGVINNEVVYNERLGVCTHPDRSYYSNKCVDLLPIIGARYMRFGMTTESLYNTDGTFSIKHGEDILAATRANGCKFVFVLHDRTPPLTPELKTIFLNYSRFVLNKYRNVIDKVELWNEWTNGTGTYEQYKEQQTAASYADFVSSIYPTLKSEYPEVEFIGLGGINPQRFRDDIVDIFATGAGQYMDAISMHPYRQPKSPDSRIKLVKNLTMDEQVTDITNLAKTYNAPQKAYITEIGYPGNLMDIGKPDLTRAQYLVKLLSLLLTSNVVEQIDWYNLYDMDEIGIDPKYTKPEEYGEINFGLFEGTTENFAVKPAAMAYRFFAKITNGFGVGTKYDDGNGFFKLTLKGKSSGELDIVWNNNTSTLYPIPTGTTAYDLMGNTIQNQGYIMLGREPVYIVKSTLSSVKNISCKENTLSIFPNPTTDGIINIKVPESNIKRNSVIELYNVNGVLLERIDTYSTQVTLNIANRPSGIYFVNLINNNNILKGKIIKNNY